MCWACLFNIELQFIRHHASGPTVNIVGADIEDLARPSEALAVWREPHLDEVQEVHCGGEVHLDISYWAAVQSGAALLAEGVVTLDRRRRGPGG